MAIKPRRILEVLFYIAAAAYPVLVFYFLVIRKTPLRVFSLFLIAFAFVVFIAATSKKKRKNRGPCF
jgi:VIT1/CCC1 family predicted Fe2+/Mn2+ transporter